MDESSAVCNMKNYQIYLIQTVESIILKKIFFVIISLLYFHRFLYRLSLGFKRWRISHCWQRLFITAARQLISPFLQMLIFPFQIYLLIEKVKNNTLNVSQIFRIYIGGSFTPLLLFYFQNFQDKWHFRLCEIRWYIGGKRCSARDHNVTDLA